MNRIESWITYKYYFDNIFDFCSMNQRKDLITAAWTKDKEYAEEAGRIGEEDVHYPINLSQTPTAPPPPYLMFIRN